MALSSQSNSLISSPRCRRPVIPPGAGNDLAIHDAKLESVNQPAITTRDTLLALEFKRCTVLLRLIFRALSLFLGIDDDHAIQLWGLAGACGIGGALASGATRWANVNASASPSSGLATPRLAMSAFDSNNS